MGRLGRIGPGQPDSWSCVKDNLDRVGKMASSVAEKSPDRRNDGEMKQRLCGLRKLINICASAW